MFQPKHTVLHDDVLPFAVDELPTASAPKLGQALRQAREARRLSLEDVAATTRISLRFLTAIENSRYDVFTGAIYAVGFARAYAKMVGLSEKWAADTLREEAGWKR